MDGEIKDSLSYSEFLALTIDIESVLTTELAMLLFKHFDSHGKGVVTSHDLKLAFAMNGKQLSDVGVAEILSNFDCLNLGYFTESQFFKLLN